MMKGTVEVGRERWARWSLDALGAFLVLSFSRLTLLFFDSYRGRIRSVRIVAIWKRCSFRVSNGVLILGW